MVVFQGFALTLAGGIVGVAIAAGLTRYLASLLFGIKPTDPLTFAAVCSAAGVVAALACAIPARRATRVDPMIALRYEYAVCRGEVCSHAQPIKLSAHLAVCCANSFRMAASVFPDDFST